MESWNSLYPGLPTFLVALLAAVFLWEWARDAILNRRAKRPLLSGKSLGARLLDALFFASLVAIVFYPEILERLGLPAWAAYVIAATFLLASTYLNFRKHGHNRQQAQGRVNPNTRPGGNPEQANQLSVEEWKVNFKLWGLIVGFAVIFIAGLMMLLPLAFDGVGWSGIAGLVGLFALISALLALLTFAVVGRWPGRVSLQGSVVIQRPIAEVWNALQLRDTTDWWNPVVQRVQALPGPGESYKLHYFCDDTCGQCGLPRDPDVSTRAALIEVLDKQDRNSMHLRSRVVGSPSVEGLMDFEESILKFEAIASEITRVTMQNVCVQPKMWLATLLKLGDPVNQELLVAKASLEGLKSATLYGGAVARIDAHRKAEKFCGCALGAPIEGKFIR